MIAPIRSGGGDLPPPIDPPADSPLHLDFLPSTAAARVLPDWRRLEEKLNSPALMCSHSWTETWVEHYGDLVPHQFVLAYKGSELCGAALLTHGVGQKTGPFPVRTVHLGTAGEPEPDSVCVEYNRLLVEKKHQTAFLRALIADIDQRPGWDELCLDGFEDGEIDPRLVADGSWQVTASPSHYFDLTTARRAGTDALSQLGYATRKNIRKNLKAYGRLTTEWAEGVEDAASIFDDLVRLHQSRWQEAGRPGAYASRRFHQFHRGLLEKLVPAGRMGLFRVCCGDAVIGCVQLLIDGNRVLVYQGGSAPYDGKLSPGVIVDYLCLEECLARGFDAYDFLRGDSHHKQKLSTNSNRLVWFARRRPRLKFAVVETARRWKHTWKSVSKAFAS